MPRCCISVETLWPQKKYILYLRSVRIGRCRIVHTLLTLLFPELLVLIWASDILLTQFFGTELSWLFLLSKKENQEQQSIELWSSAGSQHNCKHNKSILWSQTIWLQTSGSHDQNCQNLTGCYQGLLIAQEILSWMIKEETPVSRSQCLNITWIKGELCSASLAERRHRYPTSLQTCKSCQKVKSIKETFRAN